MNFTPTPQLRRRQRFQLRRQHYQPLDAPPPSAPEMVQVVKPNDSKVMQEAEEARERILRMQADHENHRKRLTRDSKEKVKFALEGLLTNLLPVMDNFQRALAHAGENPEVIAFAKGMELTHRQLLDTLEGSALSKIDSLGKPFDPHFHEAIGTEAADGVEEGTVLEVVQEGYTLNSRVLRPALVKVAQ